ncbi:MAG: hypothetical protein ACREQB_09400 [Candidatus Binataceae bacterium]
MATKRAKNRGKRWLLLAAVALIIVGFLFRRSMLPRAMEYLTKRPADPPADGQIVQQHPTPSPTTANVQPGSVASPSAVPSLASGRQAVPDEQLGAHDRRALDDLLKSKSK